MDTNKIKLSELAANVAALYMAVSHVNLDDKECGSNLDAYTLSLLQTASILLEKGYDSENLEMQISDISEMMREQEIIDVGSITDEHSFVLCIMHLCMVSMELIGAAKYALV